MERICREKLPMILHVSKQTHLTKNIINLIQINRKNVVEDDPQPRSFWSPVSLG